MILTVALSLATTGDPPSVSDLRYRWLTATGPTAEAGPDGITQQLANFPEFTLDVGDPPDGAQELVLYDSTDLTNWNPANYAVQYFKYRLDLLPPDVPVAIVPLPGGPEQCVCYIVTRDGHGAAQADVPITFWLFSAPISDSYATTAITETSDEDGLLTVELRKGARYHARRGEGGDRINFTVPDDEDSFQLPQVLGDP